MLKFKKIKGNLIHPTAIINWDELIIGKGAKFTRGRFWKLIFKKKFINKNNALKFEYKVKNNKSLKMKLINE